MTLQFPRTQSYKPFRHPPSHSSMRLRASLALAALSLLCSAMCTDAFIMPGIVVPARSFLQVCCSLPAQLATITHIQPCRQAAARGDSARRRHAEHAIQHICRTASVVNPAICIVLPFLGERKKREGDLNCFVSDGFIYLSYVPLSPNNSTRSTVSRRCTHRQQTARWLTWRGWLTSRRCCLH